MTNEHGTIQNEKNIQKPENEISEEFSNEILDLTTAVHACDRTSYDLHERMTSEEINLNIANCFSFLRKHSEEVKRAILENDRDVFDLIDALSHYALRTIKAENAGEALTERQIMDQAIREKTKIELLSFFNENLETIRQFVSDSFSKVMSEETISLSAIPAFNIANNYLKLSLGKNVGAEKHSIINAIKVIEPIAPILKKIKENRTDESPWTIFGTIKSGNDLLLQIGDEEIVREYINDFVNDRETDMFWSSSFKKLFPSDGRTSYWNNSINEKLFYGQSSDYTEPEIRRALQIISNVPREKIMRGILECYQLPYQPMADAWIRSDSPENVGSTHYDNLLAIRDLEKTKPESTKKLFDQNGICCFSRYRKALLLEQLEPLSEGEPRGLMATRYEDWNGAFSGSQMKSAHDKIQDASENAEIKLRVLEYDDTVDLFFRLEKMCAKSENDPEIQQAEYVFINQHGEKIFTEEKKEQIKGEWDFVLGIGENRESLIIKPGGTVACLMCHGGQKNNAMDVIAQGYKDYDVSTIGPSHVTQGINSVSFTRDAKTGKLVIDIDYAYYKKDPGHIDGKTMRYEYKNDDIPQ